MFSWFRKNRKVGLLPYISEEINNKHTNSPQFKGWEIDMFGIPDCWKKSQGDGVTVAVLDTGCALKHADLKDNLLEGKNFIDPSEPPVDRAGHGSHVAGTIAASNNRVGMVGVAPKTKIIPVKVLGDEGFGGMESISKGIIWAADQKVDFITMSLGSSFSDSRMKKAIDYAVSKGVIIFCAAGNEGVKEKLCYPARYPNVIAIGAIDKRLRRTEFTCSGKDLDFLAPGQDIVSCIPGNKYALMSGTSMSNPFAVGCACLLLAWNRKYHRYNLSTYQDYIDVFKKHAIHLQNPEYRNQVKYEGHGIINPKPCLE